MSRDVFYIVPSSESDGRNDQQSATREGINNRHRNGTDAGAADTEHNEHTENSAEERIRPIIKERVYYAAKDGLPIALTSLLSSVESETTRNAYINQVRFTLIRCYVQKRPHFVITLRMLILSQNKSTRPQFVPFDSCLQIHPIDNKYKQRSSSMCSEIFRA